MPRVEMTERCGALLQEMVAMAVLYKRAAAAIRRKDPLESVLRPVEIQLLSETPPPDLYARVALATAVFAEDGLEFEAIFEAALDDLQARYPDVFERSPVPTWTQ